MVKLQQKGWMTNCHESSSAMVLKYIFQNRELRWWRREGGLINPQSPGGNACGEAGCVLNASLPGWHGSGACFQVRTRSIQWGLHLILGPDRSMSDGENNLCLFPNRLDIFALWSIFFFFLNGEINRFKSKYSLCKNKRGSINTKINLNVKIHGSYLKKIFFKWMYSIWFFE